MPFFCLKHLLLLLLLLLFFSDIVSMFSIVTNFPKEQLQKLILPVQIPDEEKKLT